MKIKLWASTKYVGSKSTREIEVDEEEWNTMCDAEKDELMLEEFWNSNIVEWGWEEQ